MKMRVVKKSVKSGEKAAWDVDDLHIKIREIEQLSSLTEVEILSLMKDIRFLWSVKTCIGNGEPWR